MLKSRFNSAKSGCTEEMRKTDFEDSKTSELWARSHGLVVQADDS
jgi:hypothetical protein